MKILVSACVRFLSSAQKVLLTVALCFIAGNLQARSTNELIVIDPTVDYTQEEITFSIAQYTTGLGNIIISRRELGQQGNSTWNQQAVIPDTSTSWTDSTITVGTAYEYKFDGPSTGDGDISAYVACGIDVPATEDRGSVLLITDNTISTDLAQELTRLEMDLAGDGWSVIRHEFDRDGVGSDVDLRQYIQNQYSAVANLKSVYLFGRLPIVMSGYLDPDRHGYKARATDLYYADVDGVWTDVYNNTWGSGGSVDNVAGDGQYDQNYVPDYEVELEIGRVDMAGMTFWSRSETELLRDYLDKTHSFRNAITRMPRKVLWDTMYSDDTPVESQAGMSMFGTENAVRGEFIGEGQTNAYLWGVDFSNSNRSNYPNYRLKLGFAINFGSHKLDWEESNNHMRSILAMPDYGLTCGWGVRPNWFVHHMGMGKTIGYSHFRTANNQQLSNSASGYNDYLPIDDFGGYMGGRIYINLMGDPTLTLYPVIPASNVQASIAAGDVTITWDTSTDSNIQGYHVYRSTNRLGSYTRLNTNPITGTLSYTDTSPPSGDKWYMVRALKREVSPVGSFFNLSQGRFVTVASDDSVNTAPVADAQTVVCTINLSTAITLTGSDPDGNAIDFSRGSPPSHGELTGVAPNLTYTPDTGYFGPDSFTFTVWDGTAFSEAIVTIDVQVPENTAPTANDDSGIVLGGSSVAIDVLTNDTDPDGLWQADPALNSIVSQPTNGAVVIENGMITYTPNPGYMEGSDSFTYDITDGVDISNAATVTVQVVNESSSYDGDSDGLPDAWELTYYGDLSGDGSGDYDSDGVSDAVEFSLGRDADDVDRTSLTYTDNFEDRVGLLSSNPGMWSIIAGTTVEIKESVRDSSTRGLELSAQGDEVVQYIDQSSVGVLWHEFYAKMSLPEADEQPESVASDAAVAFTLTTSGDIRTFDGSVWTTHTAGLDTEVFHRYTVELDYTTQTYNLYVDGNTTAVASGVAFANTVSVPNYLKIVQGDSVGAVIDNVYISTTPPAGFGGSTPTTTYADWEAAQTWPIGADQTPSGDSDADTISNLMEYALDLDVSANDFHKQPAGGYLDDGTDQWATLTYRRNTNQGDLSYTIQKSSDLSTWNDVAIDGTNAIETIVDSDVDGDGSAELVEVKVKLSSPDETVFLRLKVDDGSTVAMTNPVNGNGFGIPSTEDFEAYALGATIDGTGGWFLNAGTAYTFAATHDTDSM